MQYCLECPGTHLPGSAEGRVWGRAGRANPHRAGVSAPGPLPLGTRGKSAENRRALPPAAPRPLPGRPDLPFSPQSPAGISPAQAGARSLALQRGVRAAGWLPPPGWSPGVSTELCRPLRGEMGWAAGCGGVPAQQRAQPTPQTLAAPSTGSSGRGPCRSGAGGVSRGESKQCPEGPWTSKAGCPVRAGGHCRTGAPRGAERAGRPACASPEPAAVPSSPQLPLAGPAAAAASGARQIWVQPCGCGLRSRLGCYLTPRGSRTSPLAGLFRDDSGRQTGHHATPEDACRDLLGLLPPWQKLRHREAERQPGVTQRA